MRNEQTDNVNYAVFRSRNGGDFWSNISYGMRFSKDEAEQFFEQAHKDHPSDLLRLVEIKSTTIYEIV